WNRATPIGVGTGPAAWLPQPTSRSPSARVAFTHAGYGRRPPSLHSGPMRWGVIALAAVLLTALAPAARADGDPASDILFFQNVFLPYPSPSVAVSQGLISAIKTENQAGLRLKVA